MPTVWNHGRYTIMIPGGVLPPGSSVDLPGPVITKMNNAHLKPYPLPVKVQPIAQADSIDTVEDQPRRRARKKAAPTEG